MLSKKIEAALNDQIGKEGYASSSYLAMASWCEKTGLRGCAEFLYEQSEEETEHMLKMFRYVNSSGGHAHVPALKEPPIQYESISEIFKQALEHEINVTKSINKIVELSLTEKDYSTFNFLQWYVSEQHEEEALFNSILDIIKITGTDGKGLFFIDSKISDLREKEASEGKS